MRKTTESPLLQQYRALKEKYADCILLFQVGDFYETFEQDAVLTAKLLDITLTKRQNGMDMAGFPQSSLDQYLPMLVKAGHRAAVCDQIVDDPGEGLLKRVVTRVATPGVTPDEALLDNNQNNFLAALNIDQAHYGLALLDVSTGEFYAGEGDKDYVLRLLDSFKPIEIIFERSFEAYFREAFGKNCFGYAMDQSHFDAAAAHQLLLDHFQINSLKGFGLDHLRRATVACAAILHYLRETEHPHLRHIVSIQQLPKEGFLWMDTFTIRNLEIVEDGKNPKAKNLLSVMDSTVSAMGSRQLKRWLLLPSKDLDVINERLDLVDHLITHGRVRGLISDHIQACGDVERLAGKVALRKITPRQLRQIGASLQEVAALKEVCAQSPEAHLQTLGQDLDGCPDIARRILKEILPAPASSVDTGYLIQEGVDPRLDELKQLSANNKHYLEYLQQREASSTGIHSLKVGYHGVYGYYLEVPKNLKGRVPSQWSLKQTLAGAERYATEELKAYEEKIISADEKIKELELKLFKQLIEALGNYISQLRQNGITLATLDCLVGFATNAIKYKYVRPVLQKSSDLDLRDSRHPVLEQYTDYVANDISLDPNSQQVIILTGPNMSGKSAILRQTALITLMAHMGSFVPASQAIIPLTDKIFTRVGASDNLSGGESTFMVEMNETASILNNITEQSLVLLDEIGRGTATYDGISIAWSIVEYLHDCPARPKTLFATHYHELNDLEIQLPRVKNFHLTHKETADKIAFLHLIAPGGSTHSFGIQVAKMAGMPPGVVERAQNVLQLLEKKQLIPRDH